MLIGDLKLFVLYICACIVQLLGIKFLKFKIPCRDG